MSDDPLFLGGLDREIIDEATVKKKMTKKAQDPIAAKNAETAAKREERIASGARGDPGPSSGPPPPTPVQDKSVLLDKITMFRERFPHLKSRNKVSAKSSLDEIEDELHYIEQQLGQRDGHMGEHLLVMAMSGVEHVTAHYWNPLGLNLNGLSKVTKDNSEEFAPILDELFIKYGAQMYVGPEMRLAMALGTLMYTVHSANTGNPTVKAALEKMNKPATVSAQGL